MQYKIMIVEDDYTQNNVLANFLKKENYEVISAYTLEQARLHFDSSIHLVVLDLMLPDGSGFSYLKELRQTSKIPIIVLTALEDEYTQLQVFDLKADEYVDKPVSAFVMTKRIAALLERTYGVSSVVSIGNYSFDFQNLIIYDDRKNKIMLTAKEMQIIFCLYQSKGCTVSRRKIMETVWGYEYIDDDRLLDSHIKNIRRKLNNDIIITVKGVGYRLNTDRGR